MADIAATPFLPVIYKLFSFNLFIGLGFVGLFLVILICVFAAAMFILAHHRFMKYLEQHDFELWKKWNAPSVRSKLEFCKLLKSTDDPEVVRFQTTLKNYAKLCFFSWFFGFVLMWSMILYLTIAKS